MSAAALRAESAPSTTSHWVRHIRAQNLDGPRRGESESPSRENDHGVGTGAQADSVEGGRGAAIAGVPPAAVGYRIVAEYQLEETRKPITITALPAAGTQMRLLRARGALTNANAVTTKEPTRIPQNVLVAASAPS